MWRVMYVNNVLFLKVFLCTGWRLGQILLPNLAIQPLCLVLKQYSGFAEKNSCWHGINSIGKVTSYCLPKFDTSNYSLFDRYA